MRKELMDLDTIREQIERNGEIRLHITYGRTGFVRARLWHADGFSVGTAGGGGYDKRSTAIGKALCALQGPEVLALARMNKITRHKNGCISSGLYGLSAAEEVEKFGYAWIDGACGVESVRKIAEALGWDWELYDCGRNRDLLILRKAA